MKVLLYAQTDSQTVASFIICTDRQLQVLLYAQTDSCKFICTDRQSDSQMNVWKDRQTDRCTYKFLYIARALGYSGVCRATWASCFAWFGVFSPFFDIQISYLTSSCNVCICDMIRDILYHPLPNHLQFDYHWNFCYEPFLVNDISIQ